MKNESESGNSENECEEKEDVVSICVKSPGVVKKGVWLGDKFTLEGVNLFAPTLEYKSFVLTWKHILGKDVGRVSFSFPITVFGPKYKFQSIHALFSGAIPS